ncbi:hypothetical protein K32_23670 [Kaistia sp. 32K]|uniref:host-nuclease inhibitor Gam family protein n=1 Tax=Kaistia sp. 32K TaxID=2795690 RepID=UPI001915F39B|nr:host-nuclease inhibitor Gam family protein [Kaistia sp. 32K]BCP53750.1 hypothetical protein K32_23670 [Kaistia sp. 32K]
MAEEAFFADDAACAHAIARLGALIRQLGKIETDKSQAVADASKRFEDQATPLVDERVSLAKQIEAYCVANRARLTKEGKSKTAAFTSGSAAWRSGRQKVQIVPELEAKILATLKKRGHLDLIRVREDLLLTEIGKPASKDKIKGIKGISIVPGEESFSISPIDADLVERT